jgi:hypothetical protein
MLPSKINIDLDKIVENTIQIYKDGNTKAKSDLIIKLKLATDYTAKCKELLRELVLSENQEELSKLPVKVISGDKVYNFDEDTEYQELKKKLDERKKILITSANQAGEVVIDGKVVPKVSISSNSQKLSFGVKPIQREEKSSRRPNNKRQI